MTHQVKYPSPWKHAIVAMWGPASQHCLDNTLSAVTAPYQPIGDNLLCLYGLHRKTLIKVISKEHKQSETKNQRAVQGAIGQKQRQRTK